MSGAEVWNAAAAAAVVKLCYCSDSCCGDACVLTKAPASLSSRPEGWWWFCSRFLDKERADRGSVKQTDQQQDGALQVSATLTKLRQKFTQKPDVFFRTLALVNIWRGFAFATAAAPVATSRRSYSSTCDLIEQRWSNINVCI